MREIDMAATPTNVLPVNSFLIYGSTKSGKTTFAGTSPRPLILSDNSEHGYESLREENWNDELTPLFEEGVRPIVWALEKETDIFEAVEKARPLVDSKTVLTVWVDSITFFADLVFNSILVAQTKRDNRQAYGELGVRLRNIRIKLSSLGVSIGWLALAQDPSEDNPHGKPMIPGQQAEKFAGSVDFVWYARAEQPQPSKPPRYDIHTRRYLNYTAGSRLGQRANLLNEPFQGTFADYLTALSYDVDEIRGALPSIEKAREQAKVLAAKRVAAANAAAPTPVAVVKPVTPVATANKGLVIRPVNSGKAVNPTVK